MKQPLTTEVDIAYVTERFDGGDAGEREDGWVFIASGYRSRSLAYARAAEMTQKYGQTFRAIQSTHILIREEIK